MTEEEYFRKNYPDSCYGDKLLSPHWDFFQDGVEFGERQSEKRIEELEKENAELLCQKNRNKSCYSCANATEKCFRNEIGCPCQNYESYKEESAELKKENESLRNVKNIYIGDLLKAKEIIKKLRGLYFSPVVTNDDVKRQDEILAEAKQFISEVEK